MKRVGTMLFVFALIASPFVWAQSSAPASQAKPGPQAKPAAPAQAKPAVQPKPDPALVQAKKELAELQAKLDQAKAEEEKIKAATDLVHQWFRRWNALDGSEESITNFLELYRPDARHLMGPRENQNGPSLFEGHEEIRQLAQQMSKAYLRIAYFIKSRTLNEDTRESIYPAVAPFGLQISVEFGGTHDVRDDGPNAPRALASRGGAGQVRPEGVRRFIVPGAAFFEIQDGKISRVRLYYAGGEGSEVTGSFYAGCGDE